MLDVDVVDQGDVLDLDTAEGRVESALQSRCGAWVESRVEHSFLFFLSDVLLHSCSSVQASSSIRLPGIFICYPSFRPLLVFECPTRSSVPLRIPSDTHSWAVHLPNNLTLPSLATFWTSLGRV